MPVYLAGVLLLTVVGLLAGCTTLKPIDVDAATLHQKIRSGEAVKVGDTIRAITVDGEAHLLVITTVDDRVVTGHSPLADRDATDIELPIDDIVLVEVSRLSSENPRRFATGAGIGVLIAGIVIAVLGGF